jgi:flagellar protein FliS
VQTRNVAQVVSLKEFQRNKPKAVSRDVPSKIHESEILSVYEEITMYGKTPHSTYQAVQITTTDRGRLLLMMYEGAIKFLNHSLVGLEEKDIAKFCRYLSKAQAIIAELMNTLDFKKGGTIAEDLDRLYDFMLFYLSEANLYRDAKRIQKTIQLIDTIYSAYREIIEGNRHLSDENGNEEAQKVGEALRRVQISL